jgi:DNA-binding CsgD family transcriptional regulator
MSGSDFSIEVRRILSDATTNMYARSGDRHSLYNYWRVTMGKICQVDAFFVGFFVDEGYIVYPYTFDGKEYEWPARHTYADNSVSAWVREHNRTYTYGLDNGLMLNRGVSFGDVSRPSADAMTVPIVRVEDNDVIGLASCQTYEPDRFAPDQVAAFEWTARVIAALLTGERDALTRIRRLEVDAGVSPDAHITVGGVVDEVVLKIRDLGGKILPLLTDASMTDDARRKLAGEALEFCQRIQTETMEILLRPTVTGRDLLATLTEREREVALLIAEGLNDAEIAERLSISFATVKTHGSRIRGKFGVRQRAGIVAKLRPLQ